MEYHIYYGDELMRFQTGTSKMLDSKIDLKAHTVEVANCDFTGFQFLLRTGRNRRKQEINHGRKI